MEARTPFTKWPQQVFHESFGFAWYAHPAAFVSHSVVTRGTAESATILQDWIDLVIDRRAAEIQAVGGLFVFHDWRSAVDYTSDGRQTYFERMRTRKRGYLRHSVVCIQGNALWRMAISAGNLVAAVTGGGKVELAKDPMVTLAKHGIRGPIAGERFPGM